MPEVPLKTQNFGVEKYQNYHSYLVGPLIFHYLKVKIDGTDTKMVSKGPIKTNM